MILYNTALFEEAGIDSENPPLGTYEDFASTAATIVDSGAAEAAIYPSPTSQFFQSWFDFYPWFAAETGQPLVADGEAQFNTDEGKAIAEVWRQLYADGLVPQEESQVDAFAEGVSAMNSAGPWAVAVYTDVEWAVVPPPTSGGLPPKILSTFADGKSVGLYTSCENRGTAWEFLKFTMSEEADRQLLEITGQMPFRPGVTDVYADFFEENPGFLPFAEQVERVIEVPSVPNSVEVWQTFRAPGRHRSYSARKRSTPPSSRRLTPLTNSRANEPTDHDCGVGGDRQPAAAEEESLWRASHRVCLRWPLLPLLAGPVRLPARIRGLYLVPRLLLRRTGGCGRAAFVVRELRHRARRPGGATSRAQCGHLRGDQRPADGAPGPGSRRGAEPGPAVACLFPRVLFRAIRGGERGADRGVALDVLEGRDRQPGYGTAGSRSFVAGQPVLGDAHHRLATWKQLGFYVLLYLAAMQNIPHELYEAAEIDGAGTLQKFRSVTVPGVRQTTTLVVIVAFIVGPTSSPSPTC